MGQEDGSTELHRASAAIHLVLFLKLVLLSTYNLFLSLLLGDQFGSHEMIYSGVSFSILDKLFAC